MAEYFLPDVDVLGVGGNDGAILRNGRWDEQII